MGRAIDAVLGADLFISRMKRTVLVTVNDNHVTVHRIAKDVVKSRLSRSALTAQQNSLRFVRRCKKRTDDRCADNFLQRFM